MSTRARIGVQLATGEIKSVYVWRDGNPDTLLHVRTSGGGLRQQPATPQDVRRLPAGAGVRYPLQVHLPRRSMELLGDRRIADLPLL